MQKKQIYWLEPKALGLNSAPLSTVNLEHLITSEHTMIDLYKIQSDIKTMGVVPTYGSEL